VREAFTDFGSYKLVNGVYYPFSLSTGSKQNPGQTTKITVDKIEANVKMDSAEFKMPPPPAMPLPQKHPEPPQPEKPKPPKEQ
jgi:outer membrane lipoprotein-sorting protein